MMTALNARTIVGTGFPTDEGRKLAKHLLSNPPGPLDELDIDLRSCSPVLLISAFFNGFLQQVYESAPQMLDAAKAVSWGLKHKFQQDNVARWMQEFRPST
ncbi:MAG: hypothetical protein SH850_06070 [Planctomycetaceae bacterium]|nr:hypothetical protein [Planctomycetaceae bacterium]